MKKDNVNILLVGAAGVWSESNHIPNILKLKKKYPHINVAAVCDINDPYKEIENKHLAKILEQDQSIWIKAENNMSAPVERLSELHDRQPIDLVVIACNPTAHYDYALWAIKRGIHVVCDKPLVVTQNSASDIDAAKSNWQKYEQLCDAYKTARKHRPNLIFAMVLRRRSLKPFRIVAERLAQTSLKFGAGITHLNILNHSGVYKYPEEIDKGSGAHDFTSGVGSLSHSAYHYIDLLSWYLRAAPGDIKYLKPRLASIFRVDDYLKAASYSSLQRVNNHPKSSNKTNVSEKTLAVELDSCFNIGLYDSKMNLVGDINFVSNHISFGPRLLKSRPGVSNPSQLKDGGRISHLYVDVHQSGLQNMQILKNDLAFGESNIQLELRSHPNLGYDVRETHLFDNAYKKVDHSLGDLFEEVILAITERRLVRNDMTPNILEDGLNNRIFSKFYELIARNYREKSFESNDDDLIPLA